MSKIITVLAFAAGGAATYALLKTNGGTDRLDGQIHDAMSKAREVLQPEREDSMKAVQDKAKETIDEATARIESATS